MQKQDGLFCLSLLTCSGAQQEDKYGLLTKVLDGKVSLLTPNRAIQPLIAVAFPNKQHELLFHVSEISPLLLPSYLILYCLIALLNLFVPNPPDLLLILLPSTPSFFPS